TQLLWSEEFEMASLASGEKRCLAHVLKNQESSLKHDDSLSLILQILLDNCDLAHVGASQSFICYIAKSSNCRWRCRAFSVSPKNTKKKGPLAYQGLIFLAQLDAPTFSPSGVPVSKIAEHQCPSHQGGVHVRPKRFRDSFALSRMAG